MEACTSEIIKDLLSPLIVGLVVGYILWRIGNRGEERKLKAESIRDLMTHRGDYASTDFRKALNKVAIIFHDQGKIRAQVRELYDTINAPSPRSEKTVRAIVGLIYNLCQDNGFNKLTEYDIDQSFLDSKQTPDASQDDPKTVPVVTPATPVAK